MRGEANTAQSPLHEVEPCVTPAEAKRSILAAGGASQTNDARGQSTTTLNSEENDLAALPDLSQLLSPRHHAPDEARRQDVYCTNREYAPAWFDRPIRGSAAV